MMGERETRRLLAAIRDLAVLGYPYETESTIDNRLVFALGEIAGIASKALAQQEDPRPD